MPRASYSSLNDSGKQRLAAMFVNFKDQRSAMSKVDCESATLDFDPAGNISGTSFKTSISRMKRDYSRLSPSDKSRMAACIINIEEADLKPIMVSVDWKKATTDFQPSGKITAVSFKTSIQRILNPKDATTGGSATKTTGKKRRAPAAATTRSASSSPSESVPIRKKKTRVSQAVAETDTALPTTEEGQVTTGEDTPPPAMVSREPSVYMTPPIKAEHVDDDAYGGEEESQDDVQFFPE